MRRFWASLIVGGSCLATVANCGDVMFSQYDEHVGIADAELPFDVIGEGSDVPPILDAGSDGPGSDAPTFPDAPPFPDASFPDAPVPPDAPADAPGPPDAPLGDAGLDDAPILDAPILDAPILDAGVDAPIEPGVDAAVDAGVGLDAGGDAGTNPIDAGVDAAVDARPDAGGTDVPDQPGFTDTTSFYACSAGAGGIGTLPMLLAIVFALRRRRPRR